VEIVNLHLTVHGLINKPEPGKLAPQRGPVDQALKERRRVYFTHGGWLETPVYDRAALLAGANLTGPAIVEEKAAAALVGPGETLRVDEYGNLIIELDPAINDHAGGGI
jgi:N-methylhydantoinase A